MGYHSQEPKRSWVCMIKDGVYMLGTKIIKQEASKDEESSDYFSTVIFDKLNRILFDKSNFVLRSIDMIENKSYLPVIRDLMDKLQDVDSEVRVITSLLSQMTFTMVIIDTRGTVLYTNKKDKHYSGMKCWDLFVKRTGQCHDCYFNPLGDKTEAGISIKKYPASNNMPECLIICHPIRDNGHSFMIQFIVELSDIHIKDKIKKDLQHFIDTL